MAIVIDCPNCNDGYVEAYGYGFPGSRCDACNGSAKVEASCEGLHTNPGVLAVTCVDGEFLCRQCAEDAELIVPLVPVTVPTSGSGVWL